MHFTALKRFGFFIALLHTVSNKKNIDKLGMDSVKNSASLYNFSALLKPRGGTPDFKWQGWLNGGKNQNPKFIPQKIPCQISEP